MLDHPLPVRSPNVILYLHLPRRSIQSILIMAFTITNNDPALEGVEIVATGLDLPNNFIGDAEIPFGDADRAEEEIYMSNNQVASSYLASIFSFSRRNVIISGVTLLLVSGTSSIGIAAVKNSNKSTVSNFATAPANCNGNGTVQELNVTSAKSKKSSRKPPSTTGTKATKKTKCGTVAPKAKAKAGKAQSSSQPTGKPTNTNTSQPSSQPTAKPTNTNTSQPSSQPTGNATTNKTINYTRKLAHGDGGVFDVYSALHSIRRTLSWMGMISQPDEVNQQLVEMVMEAEELEDVPDASISIVDEPRTCDVPKVENTATAAWSYYDGLIDKNRNTVATARSVEAYSPKHKLEFDEDLELDDEGESGEDESATIPHRIVFTHKENLFSCDVSSSVESEPSLHTLAHNVRDTISAYKKVWPDDTEVAFLTDIHCRKALFVVEPKLLDYFDSLEGMIKGDLCRAADLYLNGG